MNTVLHGDNIEILRGMADNSVDSVVTDPPYGLRFMAKHWDCDVPIVDVWREVMRVLKPGGYLLAFAGTRTQHRMAVNIEDAGFDIRDMIAWVYSTGFPKSKNLDGDWKGWGTALKPALEPITVARKPLSERTVAANVRLHTTGAINIDGCRVGFAGEADEAESKGKNRHADFGTTGPVTVNAYGKYERLQENYDPVGRFPANLIHDGSEEVVALFPDSNGSGGSVPNVKITGFGDGIGTGKADYFGGQRAKHNAGSGSAARFFYCAKASRADRNEGLDGRDKKALNWSSGTQNPGSFQAEGTDRTSENHHPTVKPTELMRYLCRLVTPPGGVVLDPFAGSGSTGKAAVLEGFQFIGIEREADYVAIANARIAAAVVTPMQAGLEFGT